MYPSDLRDDQWDLIKDLVPVYKNCKIDRRQLINAVFFITKTGSQWRYLPNDYPNWKTVYSFFMRSKKINFSLFVFTYRKKLHNACHLKKL